MSGCRLAGSLLRHVGHWTGCADCWGCWFPVGITGIFPSRNRLGRNGGILDTFDALVPTYDYPQTDQAVMEWFESAGLVDAPGTFGGKRRAGKRQGSLS